MANLITYEMWSDAWNGPCKPPNTVSNFYQSLDKRLILRETHTNLDLSDTTRSIDKIISRCRSRGIEFIRKKSANT